MTDLDELEKTRDAIIKALDTFAEGLYKDFVMVYRSIKDLFDSLLTPEEKARMTQKERRRQRYYRRYVRGAKRK